MTAGPSIYASTQGGARAWADGFAWLWRLGEVHDAPTKDAIGIGLEAEAAKLESLVDSADLAAAVVIAGGAGPATGSLPARRLVSGVAAFGGSKVQGDFVLFERGPAAVRSSLGTHAIRRGNLLVVGLDPEHGWGRLDSFWAYEAIHALATELAATPLKRLPAIGALRLDDTPGTAQHQLENRAKSDSRQHRRIRRTAQRLSSAGAVLNVAVAAEAMSDGERVPLEQVWPASVRELRAGIEAGAFETVCHGLLHLDTGALERSEIEFREFATLDAAEAGRRLDLALAWQERHLARPSSFVAPAWSYGPFGDEEAAKRGLARWYRARPGPVFDDERLYETLLGALPGLHRLDFSPLQRLADVGIPPIVAMHGALLDSRLENYRRPREAITLLRLFARRDVRRLMDLDGIRWLGATEFMAALRAHGAGHSEPA